MNDEIPEKDTLHQLHAENPPILADAKSSTLAMVIFFGSIIFSTASLIARLWITGVWRWRTGTTDTTGGDSDQKFQPLDIASLPSIYILLSNSATFGLILFYSYICERHPPYFHGEKTYDRDEFFFWTIVVVAFAGGYSLKRNDAIHRQSKQSSGGQSSKVIDATMRQMNREHEQTENKFALAASPNNEVLNRYQTEEWKGWMQFTFLLYHYMHATEVYNGIRVMITCYVWMTGYGNVSFFYTTNDYSIPRVLQMLWRLNFLVFFLCLTHGNPYILYYICPLHTYFFLMVYAVMAIGKERNYTKWWIRIKVAVLAILIFFVWDCDNGMFDVMHKWFLSDHPIVGATMGSKWEWYFRTHLDHWSTLLGMIFALNFPIVTLFYRKLEAQSWQRQWMGKIAVATGMLFALSLWANGPLMYSKIPYNSTNPYFGFIPLLTYVYLRNLTPKMRSYSMVLLHNIGKTTLETYLMQHHIWLTSNSKTILVFLPGWPRVNLAVVTYLYIMVSRKLHDLTLLLRVILLPNDTRACMNSLFCLAFAIAACYCAVFLLEAMDMINLPTVGVLTIVCGALLYQAVIDSSWDGFQRAVKSIKESIDGGDRALPSQTERSEYPTGSFCSRLFPPIVGGMTVLILGLIWYVFAAFGACAVGPLPPNCDAYVNVGTWIPIDGCNESSHGIAYRDYQTVSFGTCASHVDSFTWAWSVQPSRTHCRFGHRDEARLKQSLYGREIVFIGDSMTRNVYHASMQTLGIKDSGAYNATGLKHADISNILWGTTPIKFKWAPLAIDQLRNLKEINRYSMEDPGTQPPDLIVLGGGAWDLLHGYATDEDRQSHTATLLDLGYEMRKSQEYGAAVVWFIPTTINSEALNTEEKRDHMCEKDMEEMRIAYSRNGILNSASFVLDGPAFTRSRVSESHDGVHYPMQVYSAGAQILFNALDWLLPPGVVEPVISPRIGKMANPNFGFGMLFLVVLGVFCFDGFLGFSFLASVFVDGVMPYQLYEEAYATLHKALDLHVAKKIRSSVKISKSPRAGNNDADEEIAELLGSNKEIE